MAEDELSNTLAPRADEGPPEPELQRDHVELARAKLQLETARAELERAQLVRERERVERERPPELDPVVHRSATKPEPRSMAPGPATALVVCVVVGCAVVVAVLVRALS